MIKDFVSMTFENTALVNGTLLPRTTGLISYVHAILKILL